MSDDIRDDIILDNLGAGLTSSEGVNPLTGRMNVYGPKVAEPDVPKVESPKDLAARHKKLDDAYSQESKNYSDISNKAHAMVASGTNYSHEALRDLAGKMGDSQRTMQHLRAMKSQLPALPSTVSPAFKARTNSAPASVATSDALDALAKVKMAENPEPKK